MASSKWNGLLFTNSPRGKFQLSRGSNTHTHTHSEQRERNRRTYIPRERAVKASHATGILTAVANYDQWSSG